MISLAFALDGSESKRVMLMHSDIPTFVDISPMVAQFRELGGVGEHVPADQKQSPDIIHVCAVVKAHFGGVGGGGGGGKDLAWAAVMDLFPPISVASLEYIVHI